MIFDCYPDYYIDCCCSLSIPVSSMLQHQINNINSNSNHITTTTNNNSNTNTTTKHNHDKQ